MNIPLRYCPRRNLFLWRTLLFVSIVIFSTGNGCSRPQNVSIQELNRAIDQEIPKGSERGKVVSFLEKRTIPYTISHGGRSIQALQRGWQKDALSSVDIQLVFDFDDDGKLIDYRTKELFTRP